MKKISLLLLALHSAMFYSNNQPIDTIDHLVPELAQQRQAMLEQYRHDAHVFMTAPLLTEPIKQLILPWIDNGMIWELTFERRGPFFGNTPLFDTMNMVQLLSFNDQAHLLLFLIERLDSLKQLHLLNIRTRTGKLATRCAFDNKSWRTFTDLVSFDAQLDLSRAELNQAECRKSIKEGEFFKNLRLDCKRYEQAGLKKQRFEQICKQKQECKNIKRAIDKNRGLEVQKIYASNVILRLQAQIEKEQKYEYKKIKKAQAQVKKAQVEEYNNLIEHMKTIDNKREFMLFGFDPDFDFDADSFSDTSNILK